MPRARRPSSSEPPQVRENFGRVRVDVRADLHAVKVLYALPRERLQGRLHAAFLGEDDVHGQRRALIGQAHELRAVALAVEKSCS